MAAYNKFSSTVGDMANGVFNFGSHALNIGLSNTAPVATDSKWADITEIAAGNGYTAGGSALTSVTDADSSGTVTLAAANLVFAASGGPIGPLRYVVLYDATATCPPPAQAAPSTSAAGGSIAAGTYYYVVTATTASGETTAGNERSLTTTGSTSTNAISWAQVEGATGYKVYRSTTSGSYTGSALVGTIASGATVTYADTAAAPSAGAPPSTNGARFGPLVGWWDYGSSVTLASGETFTVNLTSNIFTLT